MDRKIIHQKPPVFYLTKISEKSLKTADIKGFPAFLSRQFSVYLRMSQEIKTLTWQEAIRLRPGMYVGGLNTKGFLVMMEYLLGEIIEQANGKAVITFRFLPDKQFEIGVSDFVADQLIDRLSYLDRGGRPPDLGFSVLICLSKSIELQLETPSQSMSVKGGMGDFLVERTASTDKKHGLRINFVPDETIFKDLITDYGYINEFLKKFAYLNPEIKLISMDERGELQRTVLEYPDGMKRKLDHVLADQWNKNHHLRFDLKHEANGYSYQLHFCYKPSWPPTHSVQSYANNYETVLGGSLVNGVLYGIKKAVLEMNVEIAKPLGKKKLMQDIVLFAGVKGTDFRYAGATKWTLDMPAIQNDICDYVYLKVKERIAENKEDADFLKQQFEKEQVDPD
jgi:DNA gyrase/topoisomerase IV subunit B